jgi:ABC-type nickel/cobalt efflux system permease component RcnA
MNIQVQRFVVRVALLVVLATLLSPGWAMGWRTLHERLDHPLTKAQASHHEHHDSGKAGHEHGDTHTMNPTIDLAAPQVLLLSLTPCSAPFELVMRFCCAEPSLPYRPPRLPLFS